VGSQQPVLTVDTATPGASDAPWPAVNRLLDAMDVPTALAHQVGPLAAIRWRQTGRFVPEVLVLQERAAQIRSMQAVPILARARAAYSGRMMIVKGPELDRLYLPLAVQGFAAWAMQANLHRPAVRHFGLLDARALLLPVAGVLYALMTVDSALRGGRGDWR